MEINRIKIQLFLVLILSLGLAHSQTAEEVWVIENIYGPSQVGIVDTIPVDINKDGFIDVVSASIEDGQIRAYINQDGVKFKQQYISENAPGVFRLSANDINGDGETDFLVTSIETNEVIAYIFDQGTYNKNIVAGEVLLPTDARAADLDGDGLVDVVSVSFQDGQLLWHKQMKTGLFETTVLADTLAQPRKIEITDINNDQLSDILVASSGEGSVRLFTNLGNGVFSEKLVSDQLTGSRYVLACYVDDDEYIDVVASATSDDQITVFTNINGNLFDSFVLDSTVPGVSSLACADLDGDQQNELISVAQNTSEVYSHEFNQPNQKTLVANSRDGYVSVNVVDINNDNEIEILTQSYFEQRNLVYFQQSNNSEQVVWEDFPEGAYHLESGDMDNDGDLDIVYTAFRQDRVYWSEKIGNSYTNHVVSELVDGPQSVTIGDIDSDGDLDIVSAGAWDDTFWLHVNKGGGSFVTSTIFVGANNAARSQMADMNNDGLMDLVISSSLDDSLRVLYAENGTYTEHIISQNITGAFAFELSDLDGNDYLDVIATGLRDNHVYTFLNQGNQNYQEQFIFSDNDKTNKIELIDINNDGLTDINLISDSKHVNLIRNNQNEFIFDLSPIRSEPINEFAVSFSQSNQGLFVGSLSSGGLMFADLQNGLVNSEFLLKSVFNIRTLEKLRTTYSFAGVSSQNNVLLNVFKDLIYKNGFEINPN